MTLASRCTHKLLLLAAATGIAGAQTLYTFPDATFAPVYGFMNSATKTLDVTMYELVDTTAQQDLAALARKGVKVRVILDQNLEKSKNQTAFTFLNANQVTCVWANPKYAATHQKTITVDGKRSLILSANLTSRYYSTGRDFAFLDVDPKDVAEVERIFTADFSAAAATPGPGSTLIWSPNLAQAALLKLITGAKKTLLVENEEMADPNITNALANRARSGVRVTVIMTNQRNAYAAAFDQLTAAGAKVYTYAFTAPLYIHAKVILADVGTATQKGYMGSINFSPASETRNRELGSSLANPSILSALATTLSKDARGATTWVSTSKLTPVQREERKTILAEPRVREPS